MVGNCYTGSSYLCSSPDSSIEGLFSQSLSSSSSSSDDDADGDDSNSNISFLGRAGERGGGGGGGNPSLLHFLWVQHCLSVPLPPNFGLSIQNRHFPQSLDVHPSQCPQRLRLATKSSS